jgi:hypothetical protein
VRLLVLLKRSCTTLEVSRAERAQAVASERLKQRGSTEADALKEVLRVTGASPFYVDKSLVVTP